MSLTCGNASDAHLERKPREAAWRLVHTQDLVCSSDGKCYERSFDEGAAEIVAASKKHWESTPPKFANEHWQSGISLCPVISETRTVETTMPFRLMFYHDCDGK
jgi:hypothetical protein